MPTASVIKVTQGGNDAPAKGDVEVVDVLARHRLRPEIDCYGPEDVLLKVAFEVGIVGADGIKRRAKELVQTGCEELERSWALALAGAAIAEQGERTVAESSDVPHSGMAQERFGSAASPFAAVRQVPRPL